jgi:hypothetical protein
MCQLMHVCTPRHSTQKVAVVDVMLADRMTPAARWFSWITIMVLYCCTKPALILAYHLVTMTVVDY